MNQISADTSAHNSLLYVSVEHDVRININTKVPYIVHNCYTSIF